MPQRAYLFIALALTILLLPARASALDPDSYSTIASGVVKIKATHCKGGGTSIGSGFLLGTSVVMTAHHVVAGCRQATVLVRNQQWIPATSSIHWFDAKDDLEVPPSNLPNRRARRGSSASGRVKLRSVRSSP